MKFIDKLPKVDFEKLVKEPIKHIMDVWDFFVLFYTVIYGKIPKDKIKCFYVDDAYINSAHINTKEMINHFQKIIEIMIDSYYKASKSKNTVYRRNIDTDIYYKLELPINNSSVPQKKLKQYLQRYINLYREGKIYGEKSNYKNFANSQEVVYKIIKESQAEYGNQTVIRIPYDTQKEKETRFFEIIAYLYLKGNIKIIEFGERKELLFLQICILYDIDNLYGITIEKDKNVLYKGKKVDIAYTTDEFTLIKELIDNKGKIDKQKFFEQVKWGNNAEKNKNRMNGLKNRVLSKLKKCGAENLKISQAGAYIALKEGGK